MKDVPGCIIRCRAPIGVITLSKHKWQENKNLRNNSPKPKHDAVTNSSGGGFFVEESVCI